MKGVNIVDGELQVGESALGDYMANSDRLDAKATEEGITFDSYGVMREFFYPELSEATAMLLAIASELGAAVGETERGYGDPAREDEVLLPFTEGRTEFSRAKKDDLEAALATLEGRPVLHEEVSQAAEPDTLYTHIKACGSVAASVAYSLDLIDEVTAMRMEKAFLGGFYGDLVLDGPRSTMKLPEQLLEEEATKGGKRKHTAKKQTEMKEATA